MPRLVGFTDAFRVIHEPGAVFEVRALNPKAGRPRTLTGYFDNADVAGAAATELSGEFEGVYFTLNPCAPALLARAANRIKESGRGEATTDADIVSLRWLLIDVDPVRPRGVSATDSEKKAAAAVSRAVVRDLENRGWPAPVKADSGNGYHALYRIALANDDEARDLLKRALQALASLHDTADAKVDPSVFNAARITKLYGTLAAKGDSTPDRPHRASAICGVPDAFGIVSRAHLEELAGKETPTPREHARQAIAGTFSVEEWFTQHGVTVLRTFEKDSATYFAVACPFGEGHGERDESTVIRLASGALAFKCHHSSCADRTWLDFRQHYQPRQERKWPAGQGPRAAASEGDDDIELSLTSIGDLLAEPTEERRWLADGLLLAGGLSLLAAKPKAGKSTLARGLCAAVVGDDTEEAWLGREVMSGPVIYLGLEEKREEVKRHFRALGVAPEADLHVYVNLPAPDTMERLQASVRRRRPVLVVVDGLYRLVRLADANAYAEVSAKIEPLLKLARDWGAHVMLTHHEGKRADGQDGQDGVLGSTALVGSVDTTMVIRRNRESKRRTIRATQRYGDDLEESVLAMDEAGRVTLAGTKADVEAQDAEQKILDVLAAADGALPERSAEDQEGLRARVGGDTRSFVKALRQLSALRRVARTGSGKRGDPYRYTLPDSGFRGHEDSEDPETRNGVGFPVAKQEVKPPSEKVVFGFADSTKNQKTRIPGEDLDPIAAAVMADVQRTADVQ